VYHIKIEFGLGNINLDVSFVYGIGSEVILSII